MSTLVGTRGGNVITIIKLPPLVAEVRSNVTATHNNSCCKQQTLHITLPPLVADRGVSNIMYSCWLLDYVNVFQTEDGRYDDGSYVERSETVCVLSMDG